MVGKYLFEFGILSHREEVGEVDSVNFFKTKKKKISREQTWKLLIDSE